MSEPRETDERHTPKELFGWIEGQCGSFEQDVAATKKNALCPYWIDRETDGLTTDWMNRWFCNPPYSNIEDWIAQAGAQAAAGRTGVMLVRSDTSTIWWASAFDMATQIVFLRPRVRYFSPAGLQLGSPNFGSALIVFDRNVAMADPACTVRRWR